MQSSPMSKTQVYNFSAGPAMLPAPVMQQVQAELLDWAHTGMSAMEVSHRGGDFLRLVDTFERNVREVLSVPDEYSVLFMHGGGRGQFAMVPMNFIREHRRAAYVRTGLWSAQAVDEAKRYGDVIMVADGLENDYTTIPEYNTWDIPDYAAYLHYIDNETVHGVEFPAVPDSRGLPLVCDMSSNLLSRPIDVSKYGLIYAASQKMLGPAGFSLAIIHPELLAREPLAVTPTIMRYKAYAESGSMPNTPVTFAWYVSNLVFEWVKKEGGVEEMAARCAKKSATLYNIIDASDFYKNRVYKPYRSRMNVIFTLPNETLQTLFLQEAEQAGLKTLKGHVKLGGIRASLYHGMTQAGVDALAAFMKQFEQQHG